MRMLDSMLLSKKSPLGEQIILVGLDQNAYRYDLATMTLRQTYDVSTAMPTSWATSTGGRIKVDPLGRWFAVAKSNAIVVIDMASGSELYSSATYGNFFDIDAGGDYIAMAGSTQIVLLDTSDWTIGTPVVHSCGQPGCAFSDDGDYIVCSGTAGARFFTQSGKTLTASAQIAFTNPERNSIPVWLGDNNFVSCLGLSTGAADNETILVRRSTNAQISFSEDEQTINHETYLVGGSYTGTRGISHAINSNPRTQAKALRKISTYNGNTVESAFAADAANYPNYIVGGFCLSADKTRGFFTPRISSLLAELHEFDPSDMTYVGELLSDIGGSGEDYFHLMACFNPDA